MAINKYDQPAQAQFINTYVPIPFEEMLAAGKAKQDRYDKASGAVDSAIAATEQITAIPFSHDEIRAKQYADTMRSIRDEYATKDLSDPFVLREMSNKLNSSINKKDIEHIQESYQGWVGYNKQIAENAKKGTPTPDWDKQKFEGYDSREGVFTGTPTPQLDPYGDTSQFMKQMGMTVKSTNKSIAPGVNAIEYSKTPQEILDHAKKNIDAFMQQPSIQQYVKGIKLTGGGNGRSDKQIALDFVQENARQWQEERLDPYNIPGAGKDGYNPNVKIPNSTETLGKEGQEANGSPLNASQWEAKTNELAAAAKAGDVNAKNKTMFLNKIDKTYHAKSIEEQDVARDRRLPDLYNKAEQIFSQKGKSTDEAKKFVNSFLSQSNIEDLLKNEKWLYRNDIDKLVDTNLELGFEDALYKSLGEFNSLKKTGYSEMKDLREATKDLLKEQLSIQKTNKELSLEKKNSILPTQETYDILNNDYLTDSSDRILYQYRDQKGDVQSSPSSFASSIKDFMSQPDNYEKAVFRVNGKEVTKPRKIDALLQGGKFTIDGVYSQPDGQGQPRAVLSIHDKDKNGKDIKVGEVEVRLPSGLLENGKNYYNEFMAMGKPNLAYNLAYRTPISNKINNNDWEKNPVKTVIGTNDGSRMEVVYNKKDSTFSINVIQPDGTVTNLQKGVEYNDLAGLAADEWYNVTN